MPGNVLVIAGICRKQHQFRHDDDVITVYVVNSLFDQTEFFTVRGVCVDRVDAGYAADLNATGEVLLDIRQNFIPVSPGSTRALMVALTCAGMTLGCWVPWAMVTHIVVWSSASRRAS